LRETYEQTKKNENTMQKLDLRLLKIQILLLPPFVLNM